MLLHLEVLLHHVLLLLQEGLVLTKLEPRLSVGLKLKYSPNGHVLHVAHELGRIHCTQTVNPKGGGGY